MKVYEFTEYLEYSYTEFQCRNIDVLKRGSKNSNVLLFRFKIKHVNWAEIQSSELVI